MKIFYVGRLVLAFLVLFTMVVNHSCSTKSKQVSIGNQVWMAENLDVSRFRNGEQIPEAKTTADWIKASNDRVPAWCYYNFKAENGKKFGKLYNWYAVQDGRGLAPEGWKIPSDTEFKELIKYLGGEKVAGGKLKMISDKHWVSPNVDATDDYGFSAVAGGYCDGEGFHGGGFKSIFWTTSSIHHNMARYRWLSNESGEIFVHGADRGDGLSVRCIKILDEDE